MTCKLVKDHLRFGPELVEAETQGLEHGFVYPASEVRLDDLEVEEAEVDDAREDVDHAEAVTEVDVLSVGTPGVQEPVRGGPRHVRNDARVQEQDDEAVHGHVVALLEPADAITHGHQRSAHKVAVVRFLVSQRKMCLTNK